ncbi:hypothetical protein ACHAQA_007120 [Verticillium albo-atrum]
MATALVAPEFTFDGRKASFEKKVPAPKRRGSAATKTAKTLSWPHAKYLSPDSLARAGFSWCPLDGSPDNVQCFLCNKSLDGWEEGDDPLDEHVKHAPQCGWAICAAIEAGYGVFGKEDPNLPHMIEARKATFAGLWPHDGKRGWKCKTKQLAEAGWKWTPMGEYDDMATCAYCELALDGWEQGDKPLDEHMSRSPDCPFFALLEEHAGKRKPAKSKAARGSKISRASVQSVATTVDEVSSLLEDMPAEHDDSIMTTASTASKKGARAKKATTTAKGRKTTKAKKEQSVEIQDVDSGIEEDMPPPAAKSARGRKRASDALDDSIMTTSEAPAPKKRATKTNSSNVADASMAGVDVDMDDAPQPKAKGRKPARGSSTKNTRKVSGASVRSTASMASLRAAPGAFPDDDEIDRQLEADLQRPLTDEEDLAQDSEPERHEAQAVKAKTKAKKGKANDETTAGESSKLWFDPYPKVDDADVEDDLRRLEDQMAAEQQAAAAEDASLEVPKKGRKTGGTRKVSKTKAQKAKEAKEAKEAEAAAEAEAEAAARAQQLAQQTSSVEPEEDLEHHDTSAGTVVTGGGKARTSGGRLSKHSIASRLSRAADEPDELTYHEPEDNMLTEAEEDINIPEFPDIPAVRESHASRHETPEPAATTSQQASSSPMVDQENAPPAPSSPAPPSSIPRRLQPPATPRHQTSPAQSARQPAVSPSPSPQPSDAENQPPSARPATVKRVALAPVAATPMRVGSPSKRNVVAGLRSTTPWTAVDVDNILSSPQKGGSNTDKENGTDRFLARGAELTSPEKRMTVEEWIYHNAEQAEAKLKHECESMVSRFEREGTRAMGVLEGMIVD